MRIKKYVFMVMLTAALVFTPRRAGSLSIFGWNFTEDGWNAALVGILSSIESLNQIANSNTAKMLGNIGDMAGKMEKTVKMIQEMSDLFEKSKIVLEMAALSVNIYNEYIEFVKTIYRNEELLGIEEIEMFVDLLDYTVFDAVAETKGKGKKYFTYENVAGGALMDLSDIFKWFKTSGVNDNANYLQLEAKVSATYQKLSTTARHVRIMRKYCYGYMVSKRYRKGAFDNREYIKYVYYSKYRDMAVGRSKPENT